MPISKSLPIAVTALLALAACGSDSAVEPGADETPPPASSMIECALNGADSFTRDCAVERLGAAGPGEVGPGELGAVLVVRHPDGGFRRFEVLPDARGIAPADGAEAAQTEWREGGIGLAVDGDRYRFPAAMVGDATE